MYLGQTMFLVYVVLQLFYVYIYGTCEVIYHVKCFVILPLFTGCIKMIGAVLKLIIFTSMVNRIINTSRN